MMIRRKGFTVLELLISLAIFTVFSLGLWFAYTGGMRQTNTAGEALSAVQSAVVLMESMQEDIRQLAVQNEPGFPLVPNSLKFSTYGKSFMLRKGALTDSNGQMLGSAFTVVVYQLQENPAVPGTYTIRRLERNTRGTPITGADLDANERVFRTLLLRDSKFDLIVRLEAMNTYRMFVRASVTAVNSGTDQNDQRTYFVSNLFEAASPEFIHNQADPSTGAVSTGFARRFPISSRWGQPPLPGAVKSGPGFTAPLPPDSWPDFGQFSPFHDYVDAGGTPRDVAAPPAPIVADPFDTSQASGGGPLTETLMTSCTEALATMVGSNPGEPFRGRIVGSLVAPDNPPSFPPLPFAFDSTGLATTPVKAQIYQFLRTSVVTQGAVAVQEMGHLFSGRADLANPLIEATIAQQVVANQ